MSLDDASTSEMQLDIFTSKSDPTRERAYYTSKPLKVHVEPTITIEVVLHGMMSRCTKCGELKNASEFGMLTDDHGKPKRNKVTIRNQPQCKSCR